MNQNLLLLGGIKTVGDSLFEDQIETNLQQFFQWTFLNIGNYQNIYIPASGAYGGFPSRLRLVTEDPYYNVGQVWEGYRQDWVWETGVSFSPPPIQISGVYVNGNFVQAGATGIYANHIDYPLGRVIFDNAIPSGSTVQCEYSHRLYSFSLSDIPWFREIQQNSMRIDDPTFLQQGSGNWSILGQSRFQLPQVVIESIPKTEIKGFTIGSYAKTIHQGIDFHIFTETPWDRKFLNSALMLQFQNRFIGFDKNKIQASGKWPLDDGQLQSGFLTFPQLADLFQWQVIRIVDAKAQDIKATPPLYFSSIRAKIEFENP